MLILHIGTHKTGTSALQDVLVHNAELLDASGVHYIKAGLSGRRAHHNLSWSLRGMFDLAPSVWDEVRAELGASQSRTNIISSEAFWFTDPALVRAELQSVADVQVVVYLRRQDKYLQSLYKQTVKGGRRMAFPQWREQFGFRGDYAKVIDQWGAQFGPEAICLRPYERQGKTIDVIEDFISRLGIPELRDRSDYGALQRQSYHHNRSPRAELTELIRAFNQLNLDINYAALAFLVMKKNPEYVRSSDLLNYEQCCELMAGFDSGNRSLVENFYRESELLFPDLAPFASPEMWQRDDPQFFKLTRDFLDALMQIVLDTERKPSKPKKPSNRVPPIAVRGRDSLGLLDQENLADDFDVA